MKAVILDLPEDVIEERHRLDLDRLDEVWEGVYHMTPPPAEEHDAITEELSETLGPYLRRHKLGILRPHKAVCTWPDPQRNFRVPDHTFISWERRHILIRGKPWLKEAPDAVIEIHSPGDETYEKVPFYESVGVREAIIVDRDTCKIELLRRVGEKFTAVSADAEGWTRSEALEVAFRPTNDGRLELRLDRDGARAIIPAD